MTGRTIAPRPGSAGITRGRVPKGTVLLVASAGAFLAFLDATVVNAAFTSIQASFPDADIGTLSWVLNAYNIVFAAFLVLCGRLADLLGRRVAFVWGTGIFTVASVLCALAGTVEVLIAFRVLQAFGAALLVPASLAVVVEAFPPARRAHAIGLWGASAALAAGLGPPIGGVLVELGDWRWAFLVNLPLGLAALLAAQRLLVESRSPGARRMPDLLGATAFAGALGLLTLAVVSIEEHGARSTWVWLPLLGSAALLAGFVTSSRRHPSPLLDATLLRVRAFAVGNAVTVVAGMGFYAYLLTNVLWLQYVWGWTVLEAGLALVPGALVAAVVAARLGPVAARYGYTRVIVPGALVWAGAYVWHALVTGPDPAFLTEWLPGQVLSGLGAGAVLPLTASAALSAVPGGRYATASAFVSSTRQTGAAIGIALLVVVVGTPTTATAEDVLRDGWWLSAACFAVCAALALLIGPVGTADPAPNLTAATDVGRLHLPERTAPRDLVGDPPGPQADQADQADQGDAPGPQARLGDVPLFASLPGPSRETLTRSAVPVVVPAGRVLFSEGDESGSLYLVRTGRLEVVVDGQVVREVGPGAALGELALLTGGPRSATVRARRDSELLQVSREAFQDVMSADPAAPLALSTTLAVQLRDARPPVRPTGTEPGVVVVAGLTPGAPVEEVAASLQRWLAGWLSVVAPGRVGREGLERAERDADRVLLVARYPGAGLGQHHDHDHDHDPDHDPDAAWWRSCVRQADLTVLVTGTGTEPAGDDLTGLQDAPDLLLLGAPDPARVTAWVEQLDPWKVTGVAGDPGTGDLDAALRPLAARIAGRSIGLVLAGGGARGLAHVGVLRELEDAGVHVDRVAGASVGAVIGAGHALGHDGATLEEICYEEFVRRNPFSDWTVPTSSLARGARARTRLGGRYGDSRIEQLPRLFRCVTTDLHQQVSVVHRSGPVLEAVLGSCALPVLLPPVVMGSRVLLDGGVLDHLPVGALTSRREGPIIAVNILMGFSGLRPPRVPSLGETLLRTMTIGSAGATAAALEQGALVITPPTLGVGLLEFHQMDVMVEAGRRVARSLLEAVGPDLRLPEDA